jgi:hypothetical protein
MTLSPHAKALLNRLVRQEEECIPLSPQNAAVVKELRQVGLASLHLIRGGGEMVSLTQRGYEEHYKRIS